MPHQKEAYSFLIPQFSTDPGWDTNSLKFGGTLRIESHKTQTHTFCSRSVQQTILCSLFFAKILGCDQQYDHGGLRINSRCSSLQPAV